MSEEDEVPALLVDFGDYDGVSFDVLRMVYEEEIFELQYNLYKFNPDDKDEIANILIYRTAVQAKTIKDIKLSLDLVISTGWFNNLEIYGTGNLFEGDTGDLIEEFTWSAHDQLFN